MGDTLVAPAAWEPPPTKTSFSTDGKKQLYFPTNDLQWLFLASVKTLEADGVLASAPGRSVAPGDYPESLATIIRSTTVSKLRAHPQYDAAKKRADGKAADSVVHDTLKDSAVEELRRIIGPRSVRFMGRALAMRVYGQLPQEHRFAALSKVHLQILVVAMSPDGFRLAPWISLWRLTTKPVSCP